jgi:hypothetical protein
MEKRENNKSSLLQIIAIVILALAGIILAVLLMRNNEKLRELEAEKETQRLAFQYELDSLLMEHEAVKIEYGSLARNLQEKDSIIQANAIEIKRLLNTQWEYVKVQRRLDQLRNISQGYIRQLDSLYTVNRELTAENVQIRANYERERVRTRELQRDKETLVEKVEEASVLRAYNISAVAINRRGLNNRETETNRARRVDVIRVCFLLAENSIAQPGIRNIYARIARPDQRILVAGLGDDYSFLYRENVLQYSIMRQVDYNREEINLCGDWINRNVDEPMMPGVYIVTIFAEDYEIGQTSFELR